MIEFYWNHLGLPLSRWTGGWADRIQWPLSEIILLWGLLCLVLFPVAYKQGWGWPWRILFLTGFFTLGIQLLSQGVTPIDLVPTVFREPPAKRFTARPVNEEAFQAWWKLSQAELLTTSSNVVEGADFSPNLKQVHWALAQVLTDLGYPAGREVKTVKAMRGITRVLGLAYGGPAYHDVITGEVVVASREDHPVTKCWHWCTVVHEIAHAQGFTREMDAEVLTYLALKKMGSMGEFCANFLALGKCNKPLELPDFFKREIEKVKAEREALRQPVVKFFKNSAQVLGLQNSSKKYGALDSHSSTPPPDHEFFRVVLGEHSLALKNEPSL
jgi:hypothetical protein